MDDTKQTAEQTDRATEGEGSRDSDNSPVSNELEEHPREIGGRKGPDPVRYGDWEKNGRCIDF